MTKRYLAITLVWQSFPYKYMTGKKFVEIHIWQTYYTTVPYKYDHLFCDKFFVTDLLCQESGTSFEEARGLVPSLRLENIMI